MEEQTLKSEIQNLLKEWRFISEKNNNISEHEAFLYKAKLLCCQYFRLTDRRWSILTKRESEIISFICAGMTSCQIAEQLCISKHTIETHKANIYNKLNINNMKELIQFANMVGLI